MLENAFKTTYLEKIFSYGEEMGIKHQFVISFLIKGDFK